MNSSLKKVGIQGVRASFHDVAAQKFFANEEILPFEYSSFSLLSQSLRQGEVEVCLMAIENSIAGSILTNYSLLETYEFKIIGEVYLRIEMNLLALKGQALNDIQIVQSHPMALLQCSDFLSKYPHLKVLESADTAESAKRIAEQKLVGEAAIASALAATIYDLEILSAGIESNKQNYTRFLVICRSEDYARDDRANKSSIRFEAAHRPGALAKVLQVFSENSLNMTKIQSVPILGRPYEYSFHVDLEWEDASSYLKGMSQISHQVVNLIHFGDYLKGERPVL